MYIMLGALVSRKAISKNFQEINASNKQFGLAGRGKIRMRFSMEV